MNLRGDITENMSEFSEEEGGHNYKMDDNDLYKKNLPVKPHMRKMEELIAGLKSDLNENTKNGQILRSENLSLEHRTKEKCNELTKCLMDDLYNFDKDLKRIIQNDKAEVSFFKQQINSLNQDKLKLQQNVIVLDSKLKVCESDVGMGFR